MTYRILSRDEHFAVGSPKRILCLDGGGLRGILSLGLLEKVEEILRQRHGGDPGFRLCHYFDLIAGTSTGAIIAAALALGLSVQEVIGHYQALGRRVFTREWFRDGVVRARYDEARLIGELQGVFGEHTTLGDEALRTGLLVMAKRLDTGSPWPLGNNPAGRYFRADPSTPRISNADYPLWKVVRASTAAPSFFDPEPITIAEQPGKSPVVGDFVDGGVSPFNNPSLQALMYATLDGYNVSWPTGADRLLLVSVGTGNRLGSSPSPAHLAATGAIRSLLSLMDDCASLVETMLQWMSSSPTARVIDRELGDLATDLIAGAPLLSYLRYNATLSPANALLACPTTDPALAECLDEIDNPDTLDLLLALGRWAAERQVSADHYDQTFDLQP
jgi:predicted acylesterase/phospholipase RssA